MQMPGSSDATPNVLAHYPTNVQAAHARYLATGDIDAADVVILAIVQSHLPSRVLRRTEQLLDEHRMVQDLGLDSLAVAEIVFLVEDLYRIRIRHSDLNRIATIRDLRAFIRNELVTKVAPSVPADPQSPSP